MKRCMRWCGQGDVAAQEDGKSKQREVDSKIRPVLAGVSANLDCGGRILADHETQATGAAWPTLTLLANNHGLSSCD